MIIKLKEGESMSFFDNVMYILDFQTDNIPKPYGLYHMFCLIITFIGSIIIIKRCKNQSEAQKKHVLLLLGSIIILLEIYKQLVCSHTLGIWKYNWGIFPFQFCSTPLFLIIIAALLKDNKLRDCIYMFLTTYGFIAGLVVLVNPSDVFVNTIGLNLQTMIHHSIMVFTAIYLFSSGSLKLKYSSMNQAVALFLLLVTTALILNFSIHGQVDTDFNMFFLSPYYAPTSFIALFIVNNFGYLSYLISYIILFSVASYLVFLILLKINKYKIK